MTSQLSIFNAQRFHNSTQEKDEKLLTAAEQSAKYQDDKILKFMKANQGQRWDKKSGMIVVGWTAAELHDEEDLQFMLLTSIRRALTNISRDEFNPAGTVYNTGERRDGGHRIKTIVWQYRKAN